MKKLLFATAFASTALASSMGCNTDTLTGLHFGLGVSVLFDKYEADVDVGTNVPYAKHISGFIKDDNSLTIDDAGAAAIPSGNMQGFIKDMWNMVPALATQKNGDSYTTLALANQPVLKNAETSTLTTANYYEYSGSNYSASRALFIKNHTFKKRTTNCGGEIKLAYFHDFGNHLMIGVDLTGVIASKNKKTIHVSPEMAKYPDTLNVYVSDGLQYLANGKTAGTDDITDNKIGGNWTLKYTDNTFTDSFTDGDKLTGTDDATNTLSVGTTFKELYNTNKESGGVLLDGAIYDASGGTTGKADKSFNEMALITAQYKLGDQTVDDPGQLTFEKSVFNPRLAFIVGGTVYGWFAGLRLGMSYTTGKVYATGGKLTGQGTNSKTVSISSPLIGLHLMKQLKIAGNNDAHLYLTADWNIGDGRRSVYMNGVRNFKQSGYNISAGVTWRFKLGN